MDELGQSELGDILGTCIELREGVRKLMWFGRVNLDGFQKILRKLDKLQISCGLDLKLVEARLSSSQFAHQTECQKDLNKLEERIVNLNNALASSQWSISSQPSVPEGFCARVYPILSSFSPLYEAITRDDASELDHQLNTTENTKSISDFQGLVPALLKCSVEFGSRLCIEKLLARAGSLNDVNFPGYFLHNLIISTGRDSIPSLQRGQQQRLRELDAQRDGQLPLLSYILEKLRPDQRDILQERDSFGRLPLHYAAEYGLAEACQAILKSMHDWGLSSASSHCNPVLLPDWESRSPLHLAVIGGHISAARTLFEFCNTSTGDHKMVDSDLDGISDLLAISLRSDFLEIVQILVGRMNVNYRGKHGETALHIAARLGREDYVTMLVNRSANVNALETIHGWSPLIIACVKGHMHIVDILLQAGANQMIRDLSGWTAKEHAAFRGYMKIAVKLFAPNPDENTPVDCIEPGQGRPETRVSRISYSVSNVEDTPKSALDLRSPIIESQVLVNLGSYASNKSVKAVDLSPYISLESSTPETGYSITISAIGATGPSYVTQLPILEDMTHMPRLFSTPNPSEVKLVFYISRATPYTEKGVLIGSGVALLENLKQGLGSKRESLMRDYTIPILEKDSLKFIGTVTFSFVIITPSPQPQLPAIATEKLWNKEGPTKIVGHRGKFINIFTRGL